MLRHRPPTTVAERVSIVERASTGETDAMIATSLGCSIWTVRKWRRRGQHHGRAGLIPRRGRPATEPLGTVPQPLRDAILALRRAHPWLGANHHLGRTACLACLAEPAAPEPLTSRRPVQTCQVDPALFAP